MDVNGVNYISLTDLARYADSEESRFPIMTWMISKDVVMFLGLWEEINNSNFNRVEFDTIKNEYARNQMNVIKSNKEINNSLLQDNKK